MTDFRKKMWAIGRNEFLVRRMRDASAITPEEQPLLDLTRATILQNLMQTHGLGQDDANTELAVYENALGSRGLMRQVVEPPLWLGIPRDFMQINLLAAFLVFSVTTSFTGLVIALIVLHIAGILWHLRRRSRIVSEHVQGLLENDLSI